MKTKRTKNPFHFSVLLLLFFASPSFAQVLASWNPAGLSSYGPSPWAPTASNASLTVGGLTRGSGVGLTGTAAGNAWGGVNWAGASNEDATFTVTANAGCTVSYSTFNLSYRRSNTGPNAGTLEYTFGSSSTYTVISTISNFTSTVTTGVPIAPISLSGVANLQNVPGGTVVKFRIFPTGGSTVGTWYVFGSAGMSISGTVTPDPTYSVSIAQTSPIMCNGQAVAALTASVTGGASPYTYSWSPSGGTSSIATGLAAGVYTCIVTSATSATTMNTYTVTEPAALSTSISAQNNVSCYGGSNGSATVSATGGTSAYTYSWLPSGGTAAMAGNLSAGNYTLNIMDANNCITSQTVSITGPSTSITVSANASASVICSGSTVTLAGAGANTYTWTSGVMDGVSFSPTSTDTYTVYGTDLNGCNGSAVTSITVNPLPMVSASASPSSTVCAGASLILNGSGANTYTWTNSVTDGVSFMPTASASYTVTGTDVNGCTNTATIPLAVNNLPTITAGISNSTLCIGNTTTLSGGGATSYTWTGGVTDGISFSPTSTNTYTVTGADVLGCINTATASVTVYLLPLVQASSSNSVLCAGQTLTLSGSGASTYTWTGGATDGLSFSPTSTNTYTVYGTDLNGCNGSAVTSITVNPLPTVSVSVSPSSTVCAGASLTLNGGGANTYTWTSGVMDGVPFIPTTSASYTVTGTDANGCTNTAMTSLTVNNLPTITANISNPTLCIGNTTTLSGGGASTYTWSGGAINGVPFAPSISTNYTVTGMDASGCVNTATTFVTVYSLPVVQASSSNSVLCAGQTLTLSGGGASTYTWTGGATDGVSFSPSSTNTYTVYGTDLNGCTGSAATSITVNPLPTVTASASPSSTICTGASLMLNGIGANTYTWTSGVTDGVPFTPTVSASYTVSGTDINGCTNTAARLITVSNLPTVTASISNPTLCIGSPTTLSGAGASTYTWSGGAINGVPFAPSMSATYTVTGANAFGCVNTATTSVVVYLLPWVQASSSNTMLCMGQMVTLTGAGASTYTWSTLQTGASIVVSPTITTAYTVHGTDANGCSNSATVMQNVSVCTGIEQSAGLALEINSYPNPNNGKCTVVSNTDIYLNLLNSVGELVQVIELSDKNNHEATLEGLSVGMYVLAGQNTYGMVRQKIIVAK